MGALQLKTGPNSGVKKVAGVVVHLATHLGAWYLLAMVIPFATYVLPFPHNVVGSLFENDTILKVPNILWIGQQLLITIRDASIGFVVGIGLAIVLAVVMLFFPGMRDVVLRDSVAIRSVPWIVLVPILMMIMGTGAITAITLICLSVFFFTLVNFYTGLLEVDQDVLDYTRTLSGITDWITFTKVRWYYALPYLFAALKTTASVVILTAVVIEWLMGREGLGYLLYTFNYRYRMDLLLALAVVAGLASYCFMRAVTGLESLVVDESVWRGGKSEQRI